MGETGPAPKWLAGACQQVRPDIDDYTWLKALPLHGVQPNLLRNH